MWNLCREVNGGAATWRRAAPRRSTAPRCWSRPSCRPTNRSASRTSRRPATCPSPRPRGCSPRSSGPSCSSATRTAATWPAACSGCTPRGTTRARTWSGWPARRWRRSARRPTRPCNLSVARGERVVQVAQVDSQFLLGTRDWTQVDVPAHCSSLGKVFLAWDVVDRPPGPLETPTEASLVRPDRAARRLQRAPASAAGRSPSTSSRSGSPVSPYPFADPRPGRRGAGRLGTDATTGGPVRRARAGC